MYKPKSINCPEAPGSASIPEPIMDIAGGTADVRGIE
jgi:hypothetical protein